MKRKCIITIDINKYGGTEELNIDISGKLTRFAKEQLISDLLKGEQIIDIKLADRTILKQF